MKKAEATLRATRRLQSFLKGAQAKPALRKRAPSRAPWHAEIRFIGTKAMTELNGRYRGKADATDILSFEAPQVFKEAGQLGELVICLPTLNRQAKELGHRPERELDVLLVHGLLHLLGLDHEKGPRQAAEMARWEARLLPNGSRGLIKRTQ